MGVATTELVVLIRPPPPGVIVLFGAFRDKVIVKTNDGVFVLLLNNADIDSVVIRVGMVPVEGIPDSGG